MCQFSAGAELANAINDVLGGANVRCAVAFWGTGAEALFQDAVRNQARIICDVTLGGTSPKALRALGAPGNDRLRHIPGLHAKVYISDRGAIVGSANASQNGVGLGGPPGLIEAGVRLAPDSEAYRRAIPWFETQWKEAQRVDDAAVDLATQRFRPGRVPGGRAVRRGSLLDLIAADPDRFSDVSIVLTKTDTTEEQRAQVREALATAHPGQADTIADLPDTGMLIGWDGRDLNRWRRTFIELWMPRKNLHVYGRRVVFFFDPQGAVMSRTDWPANLPRRADIAETDATMVRRLLDKHGDKLFSAYELAAAIEGLPAV